MSYVYHGAVLLPLLVEPEDPTKPVHLALSVEYGICKDICIPARAELDTRPWNAAVEPSRDRDRLADESAAQAGRSARRGELAIRALEAGSPDAKGFTRPGHGARRDLPRTVRRCTRRMVFFDLRAGCRQPRRRDPGRETGGPRRSRVHHPDIGGRRKIRREHSRARRQRQATLGKSNFVISHVGE